MSRFLRYLSNQTEMSSKNVLGGPLKVCGCDPMTGYFRDGFCKTSSTDFGNHSICAVVTKEFLEYSASKGNDLMSPVGSHFPGLNPGDKWCLCASRWKEAALVGKAPLVDLEATEDSALRTVSLEMLKQHAYEREEQ